MKLLLAALLSAAPAGAAELRDLCPDRPGFGTPACIVDRGHALVETGIDWQREHDAETVTHSFDAGDLLVRYGITESLEAFAGWTAYSHERVRDRASGAAARRHGTGDVILGVKQSLLNPAGDGTAVAVQVFATAPTGSNGQGEGGWTQGVIVPIQFALPADFQLALSPELERLPDSERSGHHARWTNVVGLSRAFGKVTAGVELVVSRDDDPGLKATQAVADINLAWQPSDDLQLDAEVDAGLDRDAPDVRVAFGIARRF